MPASAPAATLAHVEEFASAASAFARALQMADLRARVPTCPGWRVLDLAVHLGNVHAWAATVVETGRPAAELHDAPRSSRRSRVVAEWYAGKAEDLYQVLRAADPDSPCWNFVFGTGVAGFWSRRQRHETVVHGVDLDLAFGRTTHLDPAGATDGVDEMLRVFPTRMSARGTPVRLDAPVSLETIDTGASWTLVPARPAPRVVADRAAASRVAGPAGVLFLVLWRRLPPTHPDLSYTGDPRPARRFLSGPLTP